MKSLVRPYRKSEEQEAASILNIVWPDDENRASDYSLVLEVDGTVQGLGRVFQHSTVHPRLPTLELAVLNEAYRTGHVSLLLKRLMATAPAHTLWRTQCLESHHAAQAVLSAEGFTEVRRTYTPQVPLTAFPGDWLLTESQNAKTLGYEISSERVSDDHFRAELTQAHLQHYLSTHRINPPADLTLEVWQRMFMQGLDQVIVARRSGRLAAFASLRGAEVYWFGTLTEFAADADILNAALKREEFLKGRSNLQTLNYELDSTDPAALKVLFRLPVACGEALVTLQTGISGPI